VQELVDPVQHRVLKPVDPVQVPVDHCAVDLPRQRELRQTGPVKIAINSIVTSVNARPRPNAAVVRKLLLQPVLWPAADDVELSSCPLFFSVVVLSLQVWAASFFVVLNPDCLSVLP
jgi:hypothetical protein